MMAAVSLNKIEFVLQGLQRSSGANILALQNSFSGINNFSTDTFFTNSSITPGGNVINTKDNTLTFLTRTGTGNSDAYRNNTSISST